MDIDYDTFSQNSGPHSESESPEYSVEILDGVKRGNKSYQSKIENINVMQSVDSNKNLKSRFESGDQVDKVLSGESLYKTFTFEQSSNEEDVQKCIAFWKSVMQKNLEPIKCSIIEHSKTRLHPEPQKKQSLAPSEGQQKSIEEAEKKVHDFYKNMWTAALTEVQKRKLNEIKLTSRSRCKMCESHLMLNKNLDTNISETEIEELNEWEPDANTGRVSIGRFMKKKIVNSEKSSPISHTEQEQEKSNDEMYTCICKPDDLVPPDKAPSTDTVILDEGRIPMNSNRLKLIDVVNAKRKTGAYSAWRTNKLEPCPCEIDMCDCNKNPAIVSMIPSEKTCNCGQLECHCENSQVVELSRDDSSLQEIQKGEINEEVTDDCGNKAAPCICNTENCTCENSKLLASQESIIEQKKKSTEDIKDNELKYESDNMSQETILADFHGKDMYYTGPVRRDNKADVTDNEIDCLSQDSRILGLSVSQTWNCHCTQDCNCLNEPNLFIN